MTPAEVLGPPRRGLKFVFSGDTAPCPALEAAAQDADLLLCDATYAEPEQEAQANSTGTAHLGRARPSPPGPGQSGSGWCTIRP